MRKITEITRMKIFDGIEDGLENFHHEVSFNQNIFSFGIEDFYRYPLKELRNEISISDFDTIILEDNYKIINKLIVNYKSDENLSVYYTQKDNYIFIFSFGEYQPARYMIFLESVWKTC